MKELSAVCNFSDPRWRKQIRRLALAAVILAPVTQAAELADIIDTIRPGVVGVGSIKPLESPRSQLLGSGFVIGDGRHVLTNRHVVNAVGELKHGESLVVFVGRGKTPDIRFAQEVAYEEQYDLSLLKISGAALTPLLLGGSESIREGQSCAFTGFPIGAVLGLYPATHRGIVSAITPMVIPRGDTGQLSPAMIRQLQHPFEVFQLDATAYPGNSGSPLYDMESGRVIGVVNMVFIKENKETILEKPSGIAFAMPIHYAQTLLKLAGIVPE